MLESACWFLHNFVRNSIELIGRLKKICHCVFQYWVFQSMNMVYLSSYLGLSLFLSALLCYFSVGSRILFVRFVSRELSFGHHCTWDSVLNFIFQLPAVHKKEHN